MPQPIKLSGALAAARIAADQVVSDLQEAMPLAGPVEAIVVLDLLAKASTLAAELGQLHLAVVAAQPE